MEWKDHQKLELDWWGMCINTFAEECKQITYAHRMGLVNQPRNGQWPVYDLDNKSILDIGGGPVSMLLKSVNGRKKVVADPCEYPHWVSARYRIANIEHVHICGEDITSDIGTFDEVWVYNVLQHVKDPKSIIDNVKKVAKAIRMFEWVNIPSYPGHPHELKAELLRDWIGADNGTVELFNGENGCYGEAFYCYSSFNS